MMNLFDTKDVEYIRKQVIEMLNDEQKSGDVEITLNNENFVCAKIANRKRLFFYLHYGGFRFKGKTFRLSIFGDSANIEIDGGDVDLKYVELKGFLDNVSINIDY